MNEYYLANLHRLFAPSFDIGAVMVNYESDDTTPRYIENPEWKIKNLEEQIELLKKRDEYYDRQMDNIVSLKGELKEKKKELKKELEKLRNSE